MSVRAPATDLGTANRIAADDGGYWVRLVTKQALDREGACMENCLGRGDYDDKAGDESMTSDAIWSLRKANGVSYVAMEIENLRIGSALGPHNSQPSGWSIRQVRHLMAAFREAGAELRIGTAAILVGADGGTWCPDKAPPEVLQAEREREERANAERSAALEARHWEAMPGSLRMIFGRPSAEWDPNAGIPEDPVQAATIPFVLREMASLPIPIVRYGIDEGGAVWGAAFVRFHLQNGASFGVRVEALIEARDPAAILNLIRRRAIEVIGDGTVATAPAPVQPRGIARVWLDRGTITAEMSDGENIPLTHIMGSEVTTVAAYDDFGRTLMVKLSDETWHEVPHPAPRPVQGITLGVDTQLRNRIPSAMFPDEVDTWRQLVPFSPHSFIRPDTVAEVLLTVREETPQCQHESTRMMRGTFRANPAGTFALLRYETGEVIEPTVEITRVAQSETLGRDARMEVECVARRVRSYFDSPRGATRIVRSLSGAALLLRSHFSTEGSDGMRAAMAAIRVVGPDDQPDNDEEAA
ncbi:hypothetical protein MKL09_12160 [Methylobacterium sp. J-048]|uniref:hypothetical protein n=1 Tax=Methylobacterium sp. J-048 TaxID=2836635 RepID=UPI001FBB2309|nr:hypothetical protein [Methylobacterium sp. J-048]MCJ2057308.1 hypothetical protein [Methylobacterium sp. J-048]